jgi:hypothetical protein
MATSRRSMSLACHRSPCRRPRECWESLLELEALEEQVCRRKQLYLAALHGSAHVQSLPDFAEQTRSAMEVLFKSLTGLCTNHLTTNLSPTFLGRRL